MKITFTKEEFVAWLESKNPNETYDYMSNRDCPLAQFLNYNNIPYPFVGGRGFTFISNCGRNLKVNEIEQFPIPTWLTNALVDGRYFPNATFGNLLKSLR